MICESCGREFTPKRWRPYRPQRYCETACRQGKLPPMTREQWSLYRKLRWQGAGLSQGEAVKEAMR